MHVRRTQLAQPHVFTPVVQFQAMSSTRLAFSVLAELEQNFKRQFCIFVPRVFSFFDNLYYLCQYLGYADAFLGLSSAAWPTVCMNPTVGRGFRESFQSSRD